MCIKKNDINTKETKSLTDNQKKAFEKLVDLRSLNGAVTDKKIFVFAFSLAMQLVLESNIKI